MENLTNTTSWPPAAATDIYMYIELALGIIGTVGNGLVIVVVLSTPQMKTLTNYFIINLAVADLMTSMLLICNRFLLKIGDFPVPGGVSGELYCRLYFSAQFFWFTINASSYNLVLVTMERYFAIVHPLSYDKYFSKRSTAVFIACTWCFVFVLQFFTVAFHGYDEEIGCHLSVYPNAASAMAIGVMYFVLSYFVPLNVMICAYYKIVSCLKLSASSLVSSNRGDDRAHTLLVARKRVIRMLLLVLLAYGICWTPDSLLFLCYNLGVEINLGATFVQIIVVLKFANSILNPFIYVFKYKQFRQSLLKGFCSYMPCVRNKIEDHSTIVNTVHTNVNN
ncbi:allatostatin-A receptor-like [Saccoglossus kowalevskii]|uniref:Cholecystokinin receptor type A-like n=1 Tax=Saccoglossus kowalevskii TaxID=10224 RepID=A0ABM0M6X7_SACKO|nr:PREDICTED: cholecystokinin receptor type A-like [Saccoglossus kowalevskii]